MGIGAPSGRRVWWIVGALVVVLAAGGTTAYALTGDGSPAPAAGATATVDRGDVTVAVAATGSLTPAQTRGLGFATAGTVTTVAVRAGDQVTKNQVLARIDPADAQQRVDDAQDGVDRAAEALDDARDQVEACAAATRTPAPTKTAPTTAPPTRPAAPTTPPASATPTTGLHEAALVAAPTGAAAPDGGCATGSDPVLRAQQQVTSANLALAQAKDALTGTTIRAPIAGKVLSVAGAVGANVTAGAAFVTLADVAGMQVTASFPEADAGHLATGQKATVTLADRPGEEFPATVTQVDPVGTVSGNMVTFGALLAFDTPPGDLLVGQSAGVKVTVASVAGVLRVPTTAVRSDATVLVRTASGDTATPVGVGLRGDGYTEVTSGLIDGQEIVTASS